MIRSIDYSGSQQYLKMEKQIKSDISKLKVRSRDRSITTEIMAILQQVTINGIVQSREQFRVLDIFNIGTINPGQKINQNFITFSNATLTDLSIKTVLEKPHLFVAKKNIMFAVETAGINQNNKQEKQKEKIHLFRDKKPSNVVVALPGFILEGVLYTEVNQPITMMLEQEDAFFPMTGVIIKSSSLTSLNSATFAAINKNHILYLAEL